MNNRCISFPYIRKKIKCISPYQPFTFTCIRNNASRLNFFGFCLLFSNNCLFCYSFFNRNVVHVAGFLDMVCYRQEPALHKCKQNINYQVCIYTHISNVFPLSGNCFRKLAFFICSLHRQHTYGSEGTDNF